MKLNLVLAGIALAGGLQASSIIMNFEGLPNGSDPTFSYASAAQDTLFFGPLPSTVLGQYGVLIYNGLALISTDSGGGGNQSYPKSGDGPSSKTALLNNSNPLVFSLDIPTRLSNLSFYYSAINYPAELRFYTNTGGTYGADFGNFSTTGVATPVYTMDLPKTPANPQDGTCNSVQPFCPWSLITVDPTIFQNNDILSFEFNSYGTDSETQARSTGILQNGQIFLDDVTLNADSAVPEPTTMSMVGGVVALFALAGSRKRTRD